MGCGSSTNFGSKEYLNKFWAITRIRKLKSQEYLNKLNEFKSENILYSASSSDKVFEEIILNNFIKVNDLESNSNEDSRFYKSAKNLFSSTYYIVENNNLLFNALLFSLLLLTSDFYSLSKSDKANKLKNLLGIFIHEKKEFICENTSGMNFTNLYDLYFFSCFYTNLVSLFSLKFFKLEYHDNIDDLKNEFSFDNQNSFLSIMLSELLSDHNKQMSVDIDGELLVKNLDSIHDFCYSSMANIPGNSENLYDMSKFNSSNKGKTANPEQFNTGLTNNSSSKGEMSKYNKQKSEMEYTSEVIWVDVESIVSKFINNLKGEEIRSKLVNKSK